MTSGDLYSVETFSPSSQSPSRSPSAIFDWSGNCGTTAWWNGQIVGAYVQDDAGHIELIVPRDPGPAGRAALQAEGERLGDWLDGEKVSTLYKSPLVTWDR